MYRLQYVWLGFIAWKKKVFEMNKLSSFAAGIAE